MLTRRKAHLTISALSRPRCCDRIADPVDAERSGKLAEVFFDPRLSVIETLPSNSVIPHQKTTPDDATKEVSDRDFVGIKDFGTC